MKSISTLIIALNLSFSAYASNTEAKQNVHLIPRYGDQIQAVEYFSSKDETCTEKKKSKLAGTIVRLIEVSEVYSSVEYYCTVVLEQKDTKRISLSASGSKCKLIREKLKSKQITFEIAGDHICSF